MPEHAGFDPRDKGFPSLAGSRFRDVSFSRTYAEKQGARKGKKARRIRWSTAHPAPVDSNSAPIVPARREP